MYRNYLKIAWRNLWRHKSVSLINLLGLAIGIATCWLILLFVQHELSFDRFHQHADRIARVYFSGTVQGERMNEAHVMPPVAQTLKASFPEVEDATRLRVGGSPRVRVGAQAFRDGALAFVDPNFFSVFSLPFRNGKAQTALQEPHSVVLSQTTAARYFGGAEPLGQLVRLDDDPTPYKVSGVMADVPANSQFQFELLASMAGLEEARDPSWMRSEFFTFLLLREGASLPALEAKLPQVVETHMGPQFQASMGLSLAQFREKGNSIGLHLQALTDIYLHSDFAYDLGTHGDIRYVWIFGAIAAFMLLIACINFINLSTAGAARRAREVGIRKVIGSRQGELVRQFLLESTLMASLSLVLAFGLLQTALPLFQRLTGIPLAFDLLATPWLLPALLLFGWGTGVLAGAYPAFFMSAFQPGAVLKSRFLPGKNSLGLRNGLVVFQFFLSLTLITCTLVVYQQLHFMGTTPLGYDKEAVLILPDAGVLGPQAEPFRQQVRQDPRVQQLSTSGYLPAGPSYNNNFFLFADQQDQQMVKTLRYDVDEQYLPTLGIQLAAGRNFSKDFPTDTAAILINETAARAFGWGANALGHTLTAQLRSAEDRKTYQVIGVVRDFHFRSLHEQISPLVLVTGNQQGPAILKVQPKDISGLLASLQTRWSQLTDEPFAYSFLDERVQATYQAERHFGLILGIFAALTIFVACLGLLGLAIFTAGQRTKEIGIRKVLGATTAGIVRLLTRDFLRPVLLALVLAAPVAYTCMQRWLEDFAYRIDVHWSVFAIAGVLAVLVAFLTVGVQSLRAALANPVQSLKSE
ncbi:MAG: ABC transporter permease [Saprospiraceae bacterium]|nr:ABC transporter permease [Saprospiraceae bacterium]